MSPAAAGACLVLAALAAALSGEATQGAAAGGLADSTTARTTGVTQVAGNPAGLSGLRGFAVEAGGALVLPYAELHAAGLPGAARTITDLSPRGRTLPWAAPPQVLPSIGVAHGGERLTVALALTGQWAQITRWADGGAAGGRFHEQHGGSVSVGMAYRLGHLALGGALHATAARGLAAERTHADRWLGAGVGASVGFQAVSPGAALRVGGVLHTRRRLLTLTGTGQSAGGPAGWLDDARWVAAGPAVGSRDLPESVYLGLAHTLPSTTVLSLDAAGQLWSLTGGTAGHGPLRDVFSLRAGLEQGLWWVAPDLKARAGVEHRFTPWPGPDPAAWDQPARSHVGASAGVGWRLFGLTMDAAYAASVEVPASVVVDGMALQRRAMNHGVMVSVGYRTAR